MAFTLKELEYLESLKAGFREEYPDMPEDEIRRMAHQALEVRRFQAEQQAPMDEPSKDDKVFLIYCDDIDDACRMVGYLRGSEDDAARYCEVYNAGVKHYWDEVDFVELEQLN